MRKMHQKYVWRPLNIFWCILRINLQPFGCIMTNNFLCLLSINRKFPWYICDSLPRPKKRLRAHNLAAVFFGGECKFFFGGEVPHPKKMPEINTDSRGLNAYSIGKGSSHTRLPSVGFRSRSRFLAVSLQVTWVINPAGRLPLLSARPAVTLARGLLTVWSVIATQFFSAAGLIAGLSRRCEWYASEHRGPVVMRQWRHEAWQQVCVQLLTSPARMHDTVVQIQ